MTSLARFLLILIALGGLVYGGLVALVVFVEPQPREMVVPVPPGRFAK